MMLSEPSRGKKPRNRRGGYARPLAYAALLAALYCVASLVIPMATFGTMQLRIGEIFTLFAAFSPVCIAGLTVGCFLTNLIGRFMGLTLAPDLLFGTLATLLAGICSYLLRRVTWRNIPFLIWLPPVVFNGLIVGLELVLFMSPAGTVFTLPLFLTTAGWVALGEAIVCLPAGMPFFLLARDRMHLGRLFQPPKSPEAADVSCK